MKYIVFISFLTFVFQLEAQDWREKYDTASSKYNSGKYEEAYADFVEAQKMAPDDINLSKEISKAAYRKGQFEEAKQSYENQIRQTDSDVERAELYHNLGNCNINEKDYKEAIENYKSALRINPDLESSRYNLAHAKRMLRKQEQKKQKQNKKQQKSKSPQQKAEQSKSQKKSEENKQEPENQQKSPNQSSKMEPSDKLSDKKTERLLNELMKQEMDTKRKLRGTRKNQQYNEVKSGKRW